MARKKMPGPTVDAEVDSRIRPPETNGDESVEAAATPRPTSRIAGEVARRLYPNGISPLGRRLLEIRARIEASGVPLLNWEELEQELADRRGGVRWDDE